MLSYNEFKKIVQEEVDIVRYEEADKLPEIRLIDGEITNSTLGRFNYNVMKIGFDQTITAIDADDSYIELFVGRMYKAVCSESIIIRDAVTRGCIRHTIMHELGHYHQATNKKEWMITTLNLDKYHISTCFGRPEPLEVDANLFAISKARDNIEHELFTMYYCSSNNDQVEFGKAHLRLMREATLLTVKQNKTKTILGGLGLIAVGVIASMFNRK